MNKNVLTDRELILIKEWYFNYVHDGKDTEESEALYYKIDTMLDDKFKDGTNLQVFWCDGTTSEYNYDSNKQLFIKTGVDREMYFTVSKLFTIEELEDFIEHIDDDEIKNIRGYIPTIKNYIILND